MRRRLTTALHDPERFVVDARQALAHVGPSPNIRQHRVRRLTDGFLHPSFPSDGPNRRPAGQELIDPYDRSEWQPDGSCGTVSRT